MHFSEFTSVNANYTWQEISESQKKVYWNSVLSSYVELSNCVLTCSKFIVLNILTTAYIKRLSTDFLFLRKQKSIKFYQILSWNMKNMSPVS